MKKWKWLFLFVLAGVLLAGCSDKEKAEDATKKDPAKAEESSGESKEQAQETASKPTAALKVMENEKTGQYLADADGKTLYYFKNDKPNTSNCSGECLQKWPAFYAETFEVPEGYNKDDFAVITREDTGEKQTTYKGYPLYYFVKDQAAGDVNGQGVKDVWYIVNSDTTFAP
ncbi:COG4315 family predicted lipoprotein [Neobacillus mesonae]|uniref:COG4315 family predicted lipoprotein n=1 Tax=Neobacillus mesonae TaxID=1193713 RepID=UPI0008350B54|nr:hypothetical protein [Neobacillus mesonae]